MNQQHLLSHLFTLRLWQEELGNGRTEWRGQLKHVLSGDTRHFRDWPALQEHLQEMLQALETEPEGSGSSEPQEGSGK